ncbi:MAG: arsenate reductase ArsC [Thermoanaerobaculia bacterium]
MSQPGAAVLVLCTGNSCRSQITEAFLRKHAEGRFAVYSAGTEPAEEIHPLVHVVMAEKAVELTDQRPKSYREFLGKIPVHTVIIVCDGAAKACPSVWPGVVERLMWPTEDPAAFVGEGDETLERFRQVRDELETRVLAWLGSGD